MSFRKFVSEQNLGRFRDQLEEGAEPVRGRTLLNLLVEEEEMLGLSEEQLRRMDRHIERLRRFIARQSESCHPQ